MLNTFEVKQLINIFNGKRFKNEKLASISSEMSIIKKLENNLIQMKINHFNGINFNQDINNMQSNLDQLKKLRQNSC